MRKYTTLTIFLLLAQSSFGQSSEPTTDAFVVSGALATPATVTIKDLESRPSVTIPDVVITNHAGEPRGTATRLKGVLLKDVLQSIQITSPTPKQLSEYYLTLVATDGYKVVYSWNELFNNPVGDHVYIITSRDGKSLQEMKERILVLCTSDVRTGRRHVKGLSAIIIRRVE